MSRVRLRSYLLTCGDRVVVEELLDDHSARVVKHLTRVRGSPIGRYASLKGGVSEERFINTLLVAGALHDVGKAFYQSSFSTSGGCQHLTFLGHEWISAYFILELMRRVPNPDVDLDVAFYATLLHHHAMDAIARGRGAASKLTPPPAEEVVEGLAGLAGLIPSDVVRDAYLTSLEEVVGSVIKHAGEGLADIIEPVRREYLETLKGPAAGRGRRVLYLLSVACLVTADYLAAGEVRGPSASRFWGVVEEFSRTYFGGG